MHTTGSYLGSAPKIINQTAQHLHHLGHKRITVGIGMGGRWLARGHGLSLFAVGAKYSRHGTFRPPCGSERVSVVSPYVTFHRQLEGPNVQGCVRHRPPLQLHACVIATATVWAHKWGLNINRAPCDFALPGEEAYQDEALRRGIRASLSDPMT